MAGSGECGTAGCPVHTGVGVARGSAWDAIIADTHEGGGE